jgi:hypothetical protein
MVFRPVIPFLTLFGLLAGCGDGSPPGKSPDEVEAIRQQLVGLINADPRLAEKTSLSRDDYKALAEKMAAVPGVTDAAYAGDTLGSIGIKIDGGGFFEWRHLNNDFEQSMAFPDDFDWSQLNDPVNNEGFDKPDMVSGPRTPAAQGTYATRFKEATDGTNPDFSADNAVDCPQVGSIAIVDFYYKEVKASYNLYDVQFNIDGKEIWDRLKDMGEQAGFRVKIFREGDADMITAGNFVGALKDYTYVITNGHGGLPGPFNFDRVKEALVTLTTSEDYKADKKLENGMTYEEAWNKGWINKGLTDNTVRWTPRLIQGVYGPSGSQMWFMNECWSMRNFSWGFLWDNGNWTFKKAAIGPLYNFGNALRDKGVKVVLGYTNGADAWAVAHNLMAFFRRQFGGYFNKDKPPLPHTFWPTCMSVQTFMRRQDHPELPIYANKVENGSDLTMYADPTNLFLRKVCQGSPAIPHALMQDFVLQVGTPATAFGICWDKYWSHGEDPSSTVDMLCSKGEPKTTAEATANAACAVKIARKVTDAMLPQAP